MFVGLLVGLFEVRCFSGVRVFLRVFKLEWGSWLSSVVRVVCWLVSDLL